MAYFKCCKTREHSNLFCLICKGVFHRSCLNRSKGLTIIRDNLVWCSKACSDVANDDGSGLDVSNDLRAIIDELKAEIVEKDTHIERLKRSSVTFYDQAGSTEMDCLNEIKTLESTNAALKEDLLKLKKLDVQCETSNFSTQTDYNCESLGTQTELIPKLSAATQHTSLLCDKDTQISLDELLVLNQLQESNENLRRELDELEDMRKGLLISIETLTVDNNWMEAEIRRLQVCLANQEQSENLYQEILLSSHIPDTCGEITVSGLRHEQEGQKKIVILTDNCGKRLYAPLSRVLGDFAVQLVCKPFVSFAKLVGDSDCYVRNLSSSDYVIVLAGMNDNKIKKKDITLLADKCFKTNLLFCTLPGVGYANCSLTMVNSDIVTNVTFLKRFSLSVDLLDTNSKFFSSKDFNHFNLYLNGVGLYKLANHIRNSINDFGLSVTTNLRYVEIVDSFPSVTNNLNIKNNVINANNLDITLDSLSNQTLLNANSLPECRLIQENESFLVNVEGVEEFT